MLGRSFLSLLRVSPGLRTERVLTLGLSLSGTRYPDAAHSTEFHRRALERLRAVPGVENVALTSTQFFNWSLVFPFNKPGQTPGDPAALTQEAAYDVVNPECFAALDIPLHRGRTVRRATTPFPRRRWSSSTNNSCGGSIRARTRWARRSRSASASRSRWRSSASSRTCAATARTPPRPRRCTSPTPRRPWGFPRCSCGRPERSRPRT